MWFVGVHVENRSHLGVNPTYTLELEQNMKLPMNILNTEFSKPSKDGSNYSLVP